MRLTVYSDYSLRLLMFLAARGEKLSTIPEIARAYNISTNHLMKVASQLGRAGFIETVRGRNGGLRLGRPADGINVGDVLRHTEPDMDLVPCFQPDNEDCPLRRACRLKAALERARHAFMSVLDDYTVGDLVGGPSLARSLFGLPPEAPPGG